MKAITLLKLLLVVPLLAVVSCEDIAPGQPFTISKESIFQLNQLYSASDGQYTLLIKEISDSRCPDGAMCVWAGEVMIKGEWTSSGVKTLFELHSLLTEQQKEPDGFSIRIINVSPFPKAGTPSRPEDLVVTLIISRK